MAKNCQLNFWRNKVLTEHSLTGFQFLQRVNNFGLWLSSSTVLSTGHSLLYNKESWYRILLS